MLRSTAALVFALRSLDPDRHQRAAQGAAGKRYRARLRSEGRCIWCREPSPDRVVCVACAAPRQEYARELWARRAAAGLCRRCGSPLHTTADHFRRQREERLAAGLCGRCGKHPPFRGRVKCRRCLRRGAEAAARKRTKVLV